MCIVNSMPPYVHFMRFTQYIFTPFKTPGGNFNSILTNEADERIGL